MPINDSSAAFYTGGVSLPGRRAWWRRRCRMTCGPHRGPIPRRSGPWRRRQRPAAWLRARCAQRGDRKVAFRRRIRLARCTGPADAVVRVRPCVAGPAMSTSRVSWDVILRQWCLDQVDNAYLPRNQRDVYELDAARWIGLLHRAGAEHVTHRYTDEWNLFHQYVVS